MKHPKADPLFDGRSVAFLIAVAVQQVGSLTLLLILIITLSASEFTRFGLLSSAIALFVPVLSLNVHLAPARLYFDPQPLESRRKLLSTALASALCLTALASTLVIVVLWVRGIANPISGRSLPGLIGTGLILVLVVFSQFGATYWRIQGKARPLALLSSIQWGALVVGYLGLAHFGLDGIPALIWAYVLGHGMAGIGFLVLVGATPVASGLSRSHFRHALAYSWPTSLHMAAMWAINFGGRWVGAFQLPLESLAAYTLVTQLVILVGYFTRALFDARLPEIGSAFGENAAQRGRRVIFRTILAGFGTVSGIYLTLALGLYALRMPLPEGYMLSPSLLGLSYLANVVDLLYLRGFQILQHSKRTLTQAIGTVVAGTVTLGGSVALVRHWGDLGLLIALLGGMVLQAVAANGLAARKYPAGK